MAGIENALAAGIGFVTRPVGAAITVAALSAVVGGGLYVKKWWNEVEAKDDTIVSLEGRVSALTVSLHTSEQSAANARIAFGQRLADLQNQIQVNSEEARNARARASRLADRIRELQNVETGPMSPVLVSALDSVRDDLRGFTS